MTDIVQDFKTGWKSAKTFMLLSMAGLALAVGMPMYSSFVQKQKAEQSAAAEEANPFAASAVAAASPVVDTARQIAMATPAGQVAQAVAPVAAPVVQAAVEAAVAPKPIRKPKPEPRFETVTRHVCEQKTVTVEVDVPDPVKPVERNVVGMLAGGALGALAGHQVGGGTGRTIATIAGAAGGAYAGDRLANSGEQPKAGTHKEQRSQVVEVCHNVTEQVRVK